MVKKEKNLTDSAHKFKIDPPLAELLEKITFDSSRKLAFSPRLPELHNIHIFRRNEIEYRAVPNIHGYYVLWICLSGTGQLLVDGAHLELHANESTLVLPGQPHIRLPDSRKRRVSWLLLRFESSDKGWFTGFRNARIRLTREALQQLERLLEFYFRRTDPLAMSSCGASLQILLAELLAGSNPPGDNLQEVPLASASYIRELCELMMQMPPVKDPFKIVAARKNVTPEYLHVLFRRKTGQTPRDFMARQKLNLAQHLLVNSELTVSEIALRCGFSGIYPFSRFFKNRCKVSPSSYRKEKKH
ncbi:MAG: AraC family transcriptional regulator [Lentisphaeria bacterium]|nr:AraC family transcriptional regulator [Lentisphaeria bacterium]